MHYLIEHTSQPAPVLVNYLEFTSYYLPIYNFNERTFRFYVSYLISLIFSAQNYDQRL
jgi:hypothetical protein